MSCCICAVNRVPEGRLAGILQWEGKALIVTSFIFFCRCFISFSTSPESPHNSSRSPSESPLHEAMLQQSSAPLSAAALSWLFPVSEGQESQSDPQETGFHNRQGERIDVDEYVQNYHQSRLGAENERSSYLNVFICQQVFLKAARRCRDQCLVDDRIFGLR